jgi:peptidoglycan hydrolase-like protein with peptidoglycan-binding domain
MADKGGLTFRILSLGCALLLVLAAPFVEGKSGAATGTSSKKTATTKGRKGSKASKKQVARHSRRSWRNRGQHKIDATRAREIQEALIREHYLSGPADGVWGKTSEAAMERYQADNGWQTKVVPDSRALIKLGLGPDHDGLLNPATAMTGPIEKPGGDARPKITPAAATKPAEGSEKTDAESADPAKSSAKPSTPSADPADSSPPHD